MKNLKTAVANSLIEFVAMFGKSIMLAGAFALAGYILGIPMSSFDVTILKSLLLMMIGFCCMVLSNMYPKKEVKND